MENSGAILFLTGEEQGSSLFLQDVLFDPAALWLSETLRHSGVEHFFVVCDEGCRPAAAACFPQDTVFVSTGDPDVPSRMAEFLSQNPGPVTVVTAPILLAPEGCAFSLPGREPPKSVYTLRGSALASALKDGQELKDALSALGDPKPFQGRILPLKNDLAYRCATLEPLARALSVERLLAAGVRVMDADHTYVGPAVTVGEGSLLLPGVILRGRTRAGKNCVLGPHSMIRDCVLGDGVTVNASQLNESTVDDDTVVGPFAYVRPNCHVGKGVKVGDFVELKNSTVGDGTKISHLTYVGDSDVGGGVNFGCGTVTVNYDGEKKFRTTIGDHAFIGCNTNLVAPVTVGEGAYTAAGSTITEDVPPDSLAIARDRQTNKKNWVKKRRKK